MQFDVTAVDSATLVFAGTMIVAMVLAVFVLAAALVVLVLAGLANLAWLIVAGGVIALVHGLNYLWEHVVHRSPRVEVPADLQGQGSGTGSYPRVALKDS